jgi:ubiquitin-conjugating enzyme (huntingtin interacting protein 2)
MTSRSSFNDTARYWTEIYAGGPASKTAASASAAEPNAEVAIAGLEKAHVDQFEALGFERSKVVSLIALPILTARLLTYANRAQIDVLRRMNYRGSNVPNISEDRIVEALLK